MTGADTAIADPHRMRRAGRELLSLALIDARNHTLRWFAAYEQGLAGSALEVPRLAELNPPLWELGHVGWFQEVWISRNLQCTRGAGADPGLSRLASILPGADALYDSGQVPHDSRWQLELPDVASTRQYLYDTLEATLELLSRSDEDDDALYFYRLALFHEDMHGEAFAYMAQTLDLSAQAQRGLLPPPLSGVAREPIGFAATRWRLGSEAGAGGFVFDNEKWAQEVEVPEFEIDAQPLEWARYVEFVEDGGYDDERLWSPAGWAWVQAQARRCPRHVEQMRAGVLARREGVLAHVPLAQAATHLSWYEADAWCRWAGRRLPTEVEWEVAAHQGARRGFRWGEVWEWTATTFGPWEGFSPDPYRDYSQPWFGTHKVLRGGSRATRSRLKHPKYRNFFLPQRDDIFVGFRSCAR